MIEHCAWELNIIRVTFYARVFVFIAFFYVFKSICFDLSIFTSVAKMTLSISVFNFHRKSLVTRLLKQFGFYDMCCDFHKKNQKNATSHGRVDGKRAFFRPVFNAFFACQ